MPTPPLRGRVLSAANLLARSRRGAKMLVRLAGRDFRIPEIRALSLPEVPDTDQRPRVTAPPRRWEDQGLPPPPARPGSAAALCEAYAAGRTSPVAVLDALLTRIAAGDFGEATWTPFVTLDPQRARRAAQESEARWRAGVPLGPLDGVPVPVKDEVDLAGHPTRSGTKFLNSVVERDCFAVRRLLAGGAVIYGKTQMTEFGSTPVGTNPHHHLPRCVYDGDRAAGGSSTGSAVAVALGFAPMSLGADAGGSIRIPASLNGIFGIKPTLGRVGRTGSPLALHSLPHLGPLGSSTSDLVDMLEAIATEADPEDPWSAEAPDLGTAAADWRAALGRGVRGARVAVPEAEWANADPGVAKLGQAALRALEAEGARLVPASMPVSRHGLSMLALCLLDESVASLGRLMHDNLGHLGADLQLQIRMGPAIPNEMLSLAKRGRAGVRRELAEILANTDLIALPTTPSTAPPYPRAEGRLAITDMALVGRLTRTCVPANLSGLPAGTLPVGLSGGLPVGLQLVGDAWDEASVLAFLAHGERLGLSDLPRPKGWRPLST